MKSSEERIEELSLELQIIKEEQSPTSDDGGATLYQVRQLEEKNDRLKEAIVKCVHDVISSSYFRNMRGSCRSFVGRLRDISNEYKSEINGLKKQVEKLQTDCSAATRSKEKLEKDVNNLNEQVLELQEHVSEARTCYML